MATISALIVRIGADSSNLRATLNRTATDLRNFARNTKVISSDLFGDLGGGNKFAANFTKGLNHIRREFATTMTDLRRRLANDMIDPLTFQTRAREAGRKFNAGLKEELAKTQKMIDASVQPQHIKEGISQRIQAGALSQLKDVNTNQLGNFNQKLTAIGDIASDVGRKMTYGLTVPILGVATAGLKFAGDFQEGMNRVKAVTEGTAAQIKALRQEALDLSLKTPFTPEEITRGMSELGVAGRNAMQVFQEIPNVLKLATIEKMSDLKEVVKQTVQVMSQFGIASERSSEFLDKLVAASLSGVVDVTDLTNAFRYAGQIAASTGEDFDVLLATITALGQKGQLGTVGGTAVRNIIARLYDPSRKSTKAIEELGKKIHDVGGIFITDGKGKLLPFLQILEQFREAGAKTADVIKIFSQRAGPAFAALAEPGMLDTIIELVAKLKSATGTADQVFKTQFSGLNAELKKLSNSFHVLGVAIGDAGFLDSVTKLVTHITTLISGFRYLNPEVLHTITTIALLAATIGPLLLVIGSLLRAFVTLRVASLLAFGTGSALATFVTAGTAALVVVALAIIGKAVSDLAKDALETAKAVGEFVDSLADMTISGLFQKKTSLFTELKNAEALLEKLKKDKDVAGDQGVPTSLSRATQLYDEQKKKVAFLRAEMEALDKVIAEQQKLLEQSGATQEEVTRIMKEMMDALQKVRDENPMGGFGGAEKPEETFKRMSAAAVQLISKMRLLDESTKNAADRAEQLSDILNQAAEMESQLRELAKNLAGSGKAELVSLAAQVTGVADRVHAAIIQLQKPVPKPFEDAQAAVSDLLTRMREVSDHNRLMTNRFREMAPLVKEAGELEKFLGDKIDEANAKGQSSLRWIRLRNELIRGTRMQDIDFVKGADTTTGLRLMALVDDYTRATQEFQKAQASGDIKLSDQAVKTMSFLQAHARELGNAFAQALAQSDMDPSDKLEAWDAFWRIIEKLMGGFQRLTIAEQKFINKMNDINRAISAFGELLGQLGLANDSINQMVQGLAGVFKSIGDIKDAKNDLGKFDWLKALPGVFGVIGGAASFLSGIFGGDKEKNAAMQENTRAIRDLTMKIQTSLGGLGNITKIGGIINQGPRFAQNGISINWGGMFTQKDVDALKDFFKGKINVDQLNAQLSHLGITFQDLQQAAKDLNIQLVDSEGKFHPEFLGQLGLAASDAAKALVKFSNTIDTKLSIENLKTKLEKGTLSAQDEVLNIVKVLKEMAPGLDAFVGGFSGSAANMRKQILALINGIESGAVAASAFGAFGSADEVLAFLNQFADALGNASDAADQASQSMLNVPTGFKLALREFQAQLPKGVGVPTLPPGTQLGGPKGTLSADAVAITSTQESSTNQLLGALQAILEALGAPVADRTATTARTGLETAAGSATDALTALISALSGAGATVGPSVKSMMDVIIELLHTEAAAAMRGLQESILKNEPVPTTVTTQTTAPAKPQTVNFNFGDVQINGVNKTAQEQWKDVKAVAQQEAVVKFGNKARWAEVP